MTLTEVVKKAREKGIGQCRGTFFGDSLRGYISIHDIDSYLDHISYCCMDGLLVYARRSQWINEQELEDLRGKLSQAVKEKYQSNICQANDNLGVTFEEFAGLLEGE